MTDKVSCTLCKKWEGHIIVEHLRDSHPEVGLTEYVKKHGGQLFSAAGRRALQEDRQAHFVRHAEPRVIHEVFEITPPSKATAEEKPRKFLLRNIDVYVDKHPTTPPIDSNYEFPEQALRRVLMGIALPVRNTVYLHGYSGTGKTELVRQVAGRLNYSFTRLQGDKDISRRQLIGDWVVENGSTVFRYGALVRAMVEGHILLIDEIDSFNPASLTILRSVLENEPSIVILENGGEVIRAHPSFRVVATANTKGSGDDTGLFVTTRTLSVADRQRFSIWAPVNFMPGKQEVAMIRKRFDKLPEVSVARYYQVVKAIREKHIAGEFEESFSPREFINWVEKFYLMGDELEAAQTTFIERYANNAMQIAVTELVRAAFQSGVQPKPVD